MGGTTKKRPKGGREGILRFLGGNGEVSEKMDFFGKREHSSRKKRGKSFSQKEGGGVLNAGREGGKKSLRLNLSFQ